jgi:hypothetical protein
MKLFGTNSRSIDLSPSNRPYIQLVEPFPMNNCWGCEPISGEGCIKLQIVWLNNPNSHHCSFSKLGLFLRTFCRRKSRTFLWKSQMQKLEYYKSIGKLPHATFTCKEFYNKRFFIRRQKIVFVFWLKMQELFRKV